MAEQFRCSLIMITVKTKAWERLKETIVIMLEVC